MNIKIHRLYKKKGYTISRVYINAIRFGDGKNWCYVLEDEDRGLYNSMDAEAIQRQKVPGKTAIPYGTYEVTVTYSPRFKRKLPLVNGVKGFSGIRIHPGNTAADTEGCLLPGVNDAVGRVSNSRYWFNLLYAQIERALNRGEKVWLEVAP